MPPQHAFDVFYTFSLIALHKLKRHKSKIRREMNEKKRTKLEEEYGNKKFNTDVGNACDFGMGMF